MNEMQQEWSRKRRSRDPELVPPAQVLEVLRKETGHPLPSSEDIIAGLTQAGLQQQAAELLYHFFCHPSDQGKALRKRMLNESMPAYVEIQEFTLSRPQTLMLMNGSYQIYEANRGRGRLLRFSDQWAPTPHDNWRLLDFQLPKSSGNYPPAPGYK